MNNNNKVCTNDDISVKNRFEALSDVAVSDVHSSDCIVQESSTKPVLKKISGSKYNSSKTEHVVKQVCPGIYADDKVTLRGATVTLPVLRLQTWAVKSIL